ncbi:MAG: diguanylate cyclase [Betaproteobacteria bacterium]|nr:MAG: diguanylate cyclase [Betaproteobacteria bacterium]
MGHSMTAGLAADRKAWQRPAFWMMVSTALLALGMLLPSASFFAHPRQYLPLHTALEFIAIAVSAMVFALGWNLREIERGSRLVWLGAVFLCVAVIDFGHTLVFEGMPEFLGASGAEKAINLWLAGRLVAACGLFVVVFLPAERWSARKAALVNAAMLALAASWWWLALFKHDWLPRTMIPGVGLTSLKIGVEYGLTAFHLLVAVLLHRRGRRERDETLSWLAAATWVLGLAELFLTWYTEVSDIFNVIGHLYKVAAFVMIYRALFVSGVRGPHAELAGERALLRALIDSAPDQIAFKDTRGAYLGCNTAFADCLGRTENGILGRTDAELAGMGPWPPGGAATRSQPLAATERREEWVLCRDGGRRLLDTMCIPFRAHDGTLLGEIRISRDITDRRWIEEQLAASERRLALALESASLGLWDWHIPSGWVSYDTQWAGMLGHAPTEIEPNLESWETRVNPDDWPVIRASLEPHLRGETARYSCEHRLRHKDGHWVWVLASGSVIERDEEGAPVRVVGIHQDISPRKALEERLVQQATSDPLTGLANRRYFDAALTNELGRVRRKLGRAAVVLLDLDHFKRINDQWGHAGGDEVLKHFTALVGARLRDSDLFARLGGEEFAILLPGVDLVGAFRTAERLRRLVAGSPVRGELGEIGVTVSIGVATLRAGDVDPAEALARADEALYRAKDSGRNRSMMEEDDGVVPPRLAEEPEPAGSSTSGGDQA